MRHSGNGDIHVCDLNLDIPKTSRRMKVSDGSLFWIFHALSFEPTVLTLGIEHSENKTITQSGLLANEVGPGMLQSSFEQTFILQEFRSNVAEATEGILILS